MTCFGPARTRTRTRPRSLGRGLPIFLHSEAPKSQDSCLKLGAGLLAPLLPSPLLHHVKPRGEGRTPTSPLGVVSHCCLWNHPEGAGVGSVLRQPCA